MDDFFDEAGAPPQEDTPQEAAAQEEDDAPQVTAAYDDDNAHPPRKSDSDESAGSAPPQVTSGNDDFFNNEEPPPAPAPAFSQPEEDAAPAVNAALSNPHAEPRSPIDDNANAARDAWQRENREQIAARDKEESERVAQLKTAAKETLQQKMDEIKQAAVAARERNKAQEADWCNRRDTLQAQGSLWERAASHLDAKGGDVKKAARMRGLIVQMATSKA